MRHYIPADADVDAFNGSQVAQVFDPEQFAAQIEINQKNRKREQKGPREVRLE